jgi:hypothetical protein
MGTAIDRVEPSALIAVQSTTKSTRAGGVPEAE